MKLIDFLRLYGEKEFQLRNTKYLYEKKEYLEIDFENSVILGREFNNYSNEIRYSFDSFSDYFVVSFTYNTIAGVVEKRSV